MGPFSVARDNGEENPFQAAKSFSVYYSPGGDSLIAIYVVTKSRADLQDFDYLDVIGFVSAIDHSVASESASTCWVDEPLTIVPATTLETNPLRKAFLVALTTTRDYELVKGAQEQLDAWQREELLSRISLYLEWLRGSVPGFALLRPSDEVDRQMDAEQRERIDRYCEWYKYNEPLDSAFRPLMSEMEEQMRNRIAERGLDPLTDIEAARTICAEVRAQYAIIGPYTPDKQPRIKLYEKLSQQKARGVKLNWDGITREDLLQLYREVNNRDIAELYEVSQHKVRSRRLAWGLSAYDVALDGGTTPFVSKQEQLQKSLLEFSRALTLSAQERQALADAISLLQEQAAYNLANQEVAVTKEGSSSMVNIDIRQTIELLRQIQARFQ